MRTTRAVGPTAAGVKPIVLARLRIPWVLMAGTLMAGTLMAGMLPAEGNPVRPGVGIGVVHLGGSEAAERRDMGKPAGHYTLPRGIQVDFWQNTDGTERTFYQHGAIIQMSAPELVDPLPGGITMQSSAAQVQAAYRGLRRREYHVNGGGGGGIIDYYDDVRHGIAFEFTRSAVPAPGDRPRLYAVIVHRVGSPVIPDVGEH